MPTVLLTGPTVIQNLLFLPYRWLKTLPVLNCSYQAQLPWMARLVY